MSGWRTRIQHIIDGEPVSAGVTGRPDRQLESNLQHVKELVEQAMLGEVLMIRDIAVSSDVLVGQPVYWNPTNSRAEPALAQVRFDEELGTLVSADKAEIIGVVYSKSSSTSADVAIVGWVEIDLENSIDDVEAAGRYFLSGTTPGKLELNRATLSIPVLYYDGNGRALIFPQFRHWAEDHSHHKIELSCRPAGTDEVVTTACGDVRQITGIDTSLKGWLPANHAVFNGTAPAGAKFGYNIAAHTALSKLWPPFPPESAVLTWDRGVDRVGGTTVSTGIDGLVTIDKDGIWWMSNCEDEVPWPVNYIAFLSEASEVSEPCECPSEEWMKMHISFSKTLFEADKTTVTSLRAATGSIVTVRGCAGNVASTGDLIIDAVLELLIDSTTTTGHLALKTITGGKFKQGPVTEGIKTSGEAIVATSTHPKTQQDGSILHQGVVTLTVPLDPFDRELTPQTIRLQQARERLENGIPYIGLPAGQATSALYSFYVPPAGVGADSTASFRLMMLGTKTGTPQPLTCTWIRIPRGSSTPVTIPTTTTALTMPSMAALNATNKYFEVSLPSVTIQPGDMLLLSVSRPASDSYSGEVGLIRVTTVIES